MAFGEYRDWLPNNGKLGSTGIPLVPDRDGILSSKRQQLTYEAMHVASTQT